MGRGATAVSGPNARKKNDAWRHEMTILGNKKGENGYKVAGDRKFLWRTRDNTCSGAGRSELGNFS